MLLAVIFNFICLAVAVFYYYGFQKQINKRAKSLEKKVDIHHKNIEIVLDKIEEKFTAEVNNKIKDTEDSVANIMQTYRTQILQDISKITNPADWPYSG